MKIHKETEQMSDGIPSVNFTLQFGFADDENAEECIYKILHDVAEDVANKRSKPIGSIVVLGDFSQSRHNIKGLVQMKPKINPIESFITIDTVEGSDTIRVFSQSPYDGAIVVDASGQIIGAGMYLLIDDPTLELPDGCGTRHKAAASFSLKKYVRSVLTLSEETNTIRIWCNGAIKKETSCIK